MPRKRVYISGPISDGGCASPEKRLANVAVAACIHADLIADGFAPICPQLTEYTERLSGRHFAHEVWMDVDYPWVEVSDAVLRLPGSSKGSDLEVLHAQESGVPVFYSVEDLKSWGRDQ